MTKKILALALCALLVIVGFAGCSNNDNNNNNTSNPGTSQAEGDPAGDDQGSGDLRTVSIQIDGAATPYYAPLYVAAEKGFFAQQGLEVEFYYAAAADIVKNVAAGNVEFGFPNADSVLLARSQGVPAKVVHNTYQNGVGATIFKSDSGIESMADLAGKKVAVTSLGSPNYIQLMVGLKKEGLSIEDVDVEIIGTGAILSALTTDEVDAIVFSTLRTVELRNSGVEVDEIRSDTFLPSFGNVLIAGDSLIESDPDLIVRFSTALSAGMEYIIAGNAEEAVDLSIEKHAPTAADNRDTIVQILDEIFIPYMWQSEYTNTYGLGSFDVEKWENLIETSYEYDAIESVFPVEDVIYNTAA